MLELPRNDRFFDAKSLPRLLMTSLENDLDPGETHEATGELLAHLQRVGIRFIPQPNAESVESWQSRWQQTIVTPTEAGPPTQGTQPTPRPGSSTTAADPSTIAADVKTPPRAPQHRLQPVESFSVSDDPYPGKNLPIADRETELANLASVVAGCTKCDMLAKCRTQTVFGEGNSAARFAFLGEAPGADEDRLGRPFIGRAGQLLDKMVQACKLQREDIYLLNTVKCRPPENRNPEPTELDNCRSYYEQQLQILRPEYIVCLGAISAHSLLKTKLSVGRLRQQFHQYHESKVLVIYHPAYLLRNPEAKKAAWADLQLLMRDAGLA
ncbi:Uracil-DNA glycosylase, family 4 [Rhodopirellula islandica]|uniref:Type-4 uracil-DNA glycosylase n=1 Tax=Rhodopirellula islandica TaxID=595434 RepID=A0A0J1B5X6_RHOIS|nr:uracil-DNA glycosylase [Rhodopirellula islandica]KLU01998.1 Uracil-DNA glycosylase, family 4 [Rhodopirellula islandica]